MSNEATVADAPSPKLLAFAQRQVAIAALRCPDGAERRSEDRQAFAAPAVEHNRQHAHFRH